MHRIELDQTERRFSEGAKATGLDSAVADVRSAFSRDRARVLHSAALRRLADKTQVVGPRDGDTPRTRLTHSLEVAQIARGIGETMGVDPDLAELAGLCHDIGHPPYGHNGEVALNEVAGDCGGFEGNAQTLRILTRLEPKVFADGQSYGLNLTRGALAAACKYPWTPAHNSRKYGCYAEDAYILEWIQGGLVAEKPPLAGQIMDWSDDVAYSVHDVEDGIISGRINLGVLWDFVELMALAEKGARAFGGNVDELLEAAARLREMDLVEAASGFNGSFQAMVTLKTLTSALVGRFVGSTYAEAGQLRIDAAAKAEVTLLKTIAVLYVMDDPHHLARQDRQRERIYRVFEYLDQGAPEALPPLYRSFWDTTDKQRLIVDTIASMSESRLERMAKEAAAFSSFYG